MERGMEHGMERGTDVKCRNKPNVGVNWGWREQACACSSRHSKRVESREMVADDNRRASDNLATRDYRSLQVVVPWAWMENVTCSSVTVDQRSEAGLLS